MCDADGLLTENDLLSVEECKLLPVAAIRKQILLREQHEIRRAASLQFRVDTVRIRDLLFLAEAGANHGNGIAITLELTHGTFVVLNDGGSVITCYTDQKDNKTSRSSNASKAAVLSFARALIKLLEEVDAAKVA